jgi:hypothetical protein
MSDDDVDAQALAATAWFTRYRGLGLDDAMALAESEDRPVRTIPHGATAITAEWDLRRLNIRLRADGGVLEMFPG